MRTLLLGVILLSSILLAIAARGNFDEDEYGDNDFNSDWFWIGSNLPSVGRPKFKITEHPDGYSMQLGFSGYYMRIRYTDDNSLDFNIMGYKGSAKYRMDNHYSDGAEFEGTFDVRADRSRKKWGQNVDAQIKVKYSKPKIGEYRSFSDPMHIELSFVNKFQRGERNRIEMPSMRMRGAKNLEALIKITIDPRHFDKTTVNFEMNAEGDIYRYISGNDWDENWFPGSYNLNASLAGVNFDKPGPRERQPKMTAQLDLTEDITFEKQEQEVEKEVPRNQKLLTKSMLIDGMINLTGEGSRLAVLKLTDAVSKKSVGRMQVKHPDDENYRLEMFMNGEQFAAVNYFQNIAGVTNITVEDNSDYECTEPIDEPTFDDYELLNTTAQNYTDYDESYLNNTDTSEGFQNETARGLWDSCKKVNRFLESISGDGVYESRLYNDIFYIGAPPGYRKRQTENNKNLIFEEKIAQKNDIYEGHITAGASKKNTLHCKLDNTGTDSSVEIGTTSKYLSWRTDEWEVAEENKINVDITKGNEKEDLNMKVKYNDELLFNGWFYLTELVHRYAKENVPAMINRQLDGFKETHAQTTQYVSNYF